MHRQSVLFVVCSLLAFACRTGGGNSPVELSERADLSVDLQERNPLQQFLTTETGWASYATDRTQLLHHELVPR